MLSFQFPCATTVVLFFLPCATTVVFFIFPCAITVVVFLFSCATTVVVFFVRDWRTKCGVAVHGCTTACRARSVVKLLGVLLHVVTHTNCLSSACSRRFIHCRVNTRCRIHLTDRGHLLLISLKEWPCCVVRVDPPIGVTRKADRWDFMKKMSTQEGSRMYPDARTVRDCAAYCTPGGVSTGLRPIKFLYGYSPLLWYEVVLR